MEILWLESYPNYNGYCNPVEPRKQCVNGFLSRAIATARDRIYRSRRSTEVPVTASVNRAKRTFRADNLAAIKFRYGRLDPSLLEEAPMINNVTMLPNRV